MMSVLEAGFSPWFTVLKMATVTLTLALTLRELSQYTITATVPEGFRLSSTGT